MVRPNFIEVWRLTCRAVKAANRLHAYLREEAQRRRNSSQRRESKNPEPRT